MKMMERFHISLEGIKKMLVDLDIDNIAAYVQEMIDSGSQPEKILEILTEGMNEVGTRYEQGEYFLSELVLAGETMKEAFDVLKPHLTSEKIGTRKPIVLATVKGDHHDIGKNILGTLLLAAGFDVIDLGTDCSKEQIIEAVQNHDARIVALSSLLTTTMSEIAVVEEGLRDAGLRDRVKLIVGGVPLSMKLAKELGADDYGVDAIDGVKRIKTLLD
jgi:5-methyltetrahydrofolate--homocysteine methyltransferase